MENPFKQSLHGGNVGEFLQDLDGLFKKYDLHDSGPVTLTTSNLNFRAINMGSCPAECKHIVEFCDIHHQNCTVKIECNC